MAIPVKLPVFEGPLDLLMHLIEKNKIDIYDIPIVEITDQYLEYVHQMDHEDMDVTSEFLVMAATLLDIKSRMLLPREKDEETGEEEGDPREELVRRLLEYKMFKYMSEELAVCREQAGVRYFRTQDLPKEVRSYQPPIDYEDLLKDTDIQKLEKVFGEVLRRKKSRRDPIRSGFGKIKREEVNIDTKTLYIRAYLQAHPHTDFRALLESQESKEEVIVTFLILLELMKVQKVRIVQDSICGKIMIESPQTEEEQKAMDQIPSESPEDTLTDDENDVNDVEDTQDEASEEKTSAEETSAEVNNEHVVIGRSQDEQDSAGPAADTESSQDEQDSAGPAADTESSQDEVDSAGPAADTFETMSLSTHSRVEVVSPVLPVYPEPDHLSGEALFASIKETLSAPAADAASAEDPLPAAETAQTAEPLPTEESIPEEETFPTEEAVPAEDAAPAEEDEQPEEFTPKHFSAHLWYGRLPKHVSPIFEYKNGSIQRAQSKGWASSRRLLREDTVWELARLSRLWTRHL